MKISGGDYDEKIIKDPRPKDFDLTKPPMGGDNLGDTSSEHNGPGVGK